MSNHIDENALTYLQKILAILDIDATVQEENIDETTTCYKIDCRPDDARMLIGRNGQTLEALQFIVRQMCRSATAHQAPFIIDISDYRTRRKRNVEEQTKEAAVAVLNGEVERYALPPMSPYERRLAHQYLQENFSDLGSRSEGDGSERRVVVSFRGEPSASEPEVATPEAETT